MEPLTIREAARRIRLHPATVRRYIKQGRIKAIKVEGKFGEEYRIEQSDLNILRNVFETTSRMPTEVVSVRDSRRSITRVSPAEALDQHLRNFVHVSVYNELLMKHEQMLVQFGMIRASGQKLLDFKAEVDLKNEEVKHKNHEIQDLKRRIIKEVDFLTRHLREAEIEIEEKNFQVALLKEKVRNLELILTSPEADEDATPAAPEDSSPPEIASLGQDSPQGRPPPDPPSGH
ncbi:MAG: helix-turn-helix domain-containing protein [Acidobacteriota bacterium]